MSDIRVQYGTIVFGALFDTASDTLSQAVDDANNKAWVEVTSTMRQVSGMDGSTTNETFDALSIEIEFASSGTQVAVRRPSIPADEDVVVHYRVVEYIGPDNGPFEFRAYRYETDFGTGDTVIAVDISGEVSDSAQVTPVLASLESGSASVATAPRVLATLNVDTVSDEVDVERASSGDTLKVVWWAVEWTNGTVVEYDSNLQTRGTFANLDTSTPTFENTIYFWSFRPHPGEGGIEEVSCLLDSVGIRTQYLLDANADNVVGGDYHLVMHQVTFDSPYDTLDCDWDQSSTGGMTAPIGTDATEDWAHSLSGGRVDNVLASVQTLTQGGGTGHPRGHWGWLMSADDTLTIERENNQNAADWSAYVVRIPLTWRQLDEDVAVTETVVSVLTAVGGALDEIVDEDVDVTETTQAKVELNRAVDETVATTETVLRRSTRRRPLNSTVTIGETIRRRRARVRLRAETVAISETIRRTIARVRQLAETVVITETIVPVKSTFLLRVVDETVSITETTVSQVDVVPGSALLGQEDETVDVTETLVTQFDFGRQPSETVDVTEVINRIVGFNVPVDEAIAITETIVRALASGSNRFANETVDVTEAVAAIIGFPDQKLRMAVEYVQVLSDTTRDDVRLGFLFTQALADTTRNDLRASLLITQVLADTEQNDLQAAFLFLQVLRDAEFLEVQPLTFDTTLLSLFRHNWIEAPTMETTWSTDVTKSTETAEEEYRQLKQRPRRIATYRLTGLRKDRSTELWFSLLRITNNDFVCPLFQDSTRITSGSSSTVTATDVSKRRYFPGQRVLCHSWDDRGEPTNIEYGVVKTVSGNTLTLFDSLTNVYGVGDRMYPVVDARVQLDTGGTWLTDEIVDVNLIIVERIGSGALPGLDLPAGISTYDGSPICPYSPNWGNQISFGLGRPFFSENIGRGEDWYFLSPDPEHTAALNFTFLNRSSAFDGLSFFDSRKGRSGTFWLSAPFSLFTLSGLASNSVTIEAPVNVAVTNVEDFLKHISLQRTDGSIEILEVSSVTDNGSTWEIGVNETLSATVLADVKRMSPAYRMRFQTDTYRETWPSADVLQLGITARQVLSNEAITVTGLTELNPTPTPVPESVDDLWLWVDSVGTDVRPFPMFGSNVAELSDATSGRSLRGVSADDMILLQPLDHSILQGLPSIYRKDNHLRVYKDGALTTEYPWESGNGLTIFLAINTPDSTTNDEILYYENSSGSIVLDWDEGRVQFYQSAGSASSSFRIDGTHLYDGERKLLVLRYEPSVQLRLWENGVVVGTASSSPTSIPTPDPVNDDQRWLTISSATDPEIDGLSDQLEIMSIVVYDNAISVAEMNTVGQFLADRFNLTWTNIS